MDENVFNGLRMKDTLRAAVVCFVLAAIVVSVFCCFAGCNGEKKETVSCDYKLDEDALFVANIPFDEYLKDLPVENDVTVYDIRDYGASVNADFKVNRTAINTAIEAASSKGGGVVLVDGGEYSCANIQLKSNVTLKIERDSALVNITYEQEINENAGFNDSTEEVPTVRNGFVYAENAENVTIEGPGKLKGNGATYCYEQEDPSVFQPLETFNLKTFVLEHRKRIMMGRVHEMQRYFMIAVNYCKNVTVRNLEIYEAGSWTCRMEGNEGLLFEDVVINNNVRVANSDGIDIMGGTDTVVRHCFIATGDDAVCLKTDPGNIPVKNVLVENCEIMSLANCFKTGTASYNDISDVIVRNCFFFMPDIAGGYSGIAIEATDGGAVYDITVENIDMYCVTSPLLIWLGYRKQGSELHDVTVRNVNASGCDIASAVTGYENASVKNVTLSGFNVMYREAKEDLDIYMGNDAYCGNLNMGGYPEITRVSHKFIYNHEFSDYWDLPVYGLYVRYAENIIVTDFNVTPRSCNTRQMTNLN